MKVDAKLLQKAAIDGIRMNRPFMILFYDEAGELVGSTIEVGLSKRAERPARTKATK